MSQRVIVTGATGLLGKRLCRRLIDKGYDVVVFSRDPASARQAVPGAASYVAWTPAEAGPWAAAIDGAHAVYSLAGAAVMGGRWTDAYKQKILNSRVIGTRALVKAMGEATNRPQVFVSMSGIDIYADQTGAPLDETAALGHDFLAQVCQAWEGEAVKAEALGIRTVRLRTGIVLANEGGALPLMSLPFKLFAGGPILPGTQYVPWIHIDDQIELMVWAMQNEAVSGPLNATAPRPVTNREFSAEIGRAMGRPSWFPVPQFALNLALGEAASSITTGHNVLPVKAQALGYRFHFMELDVALADLIGCANCS